jgi:predicted RNA-binding protein with PUA-like domain
MKKGDQVFFYHSNIGREIVGIMEVIREAYPDPADSKGKFVLVDVKPVRKLAHPVTLADIKAHKELQNMALIRQSRLSVMPVNEEEWNIILELGQS